MIGAEIADAAGALADFLDAESDAILKGAFLEAPDRAERKDALTSALEQAADALGEEHVPAGGIGPAAERALRRLKRAKDRNARLLEGALDGLAQAQARVRQIARQSAEVGVYGEDGGKVQFSESLPGRGRRA